MAAFFSQHTCNKYCKAEWSKPVERTTYYPVQEGTSMLSSTEYMPGPSMARSRAAFKSPLGRLAE